MNRDHSQARRASQRHQADDHRRSGPATTVRRPGQALRQLRQVTRDPVARDSRTGEQGPQTCQEEGNGTMGTSYLPGPWRARLPRRQDRKLLAAEPQATQAILLH